MKGLERTADGRCRIGSQFMIWVGDLEYKVGQPCNFFYFLTACAYKLMENFYNISVPYTGILPVYRSLLRIRIRSYPDLFAGTGQNSGSDPDDA
jgi:hypothetical protein